MLRKITAYLLFIFSLLFAALFFLLQGVTIKSLTFPGVKVTQLYIKLDKKLILDVEEIVISKQSNVEHSFDDIKKDIEKLPLYLKYFQQVHIEKLEISGNEFVIEINDDILFIDNKFINIAAKPDFSNHKVTLDLYSLYLKDFDTLLNGVMLIDNIQDYTEFKGTYSRKNVKGDLQITADNDYLDFNINSNDMKNIHFVKELVRLHPIIEEWMYDNVLGTYNLKNFSGRVSTVNFQPLLKSFRGEATVTDAKIRFHKDVDYVKTPKVTVKFGDDNLSFDLLKPKYKDIDIDGSNVIIHNISGVGSDIDVNLFTKHRLSQDVLDIIKAYEVDLPIIQLDGKTDSKLTINVDFTTEEVSLDGEFKTKAANFKLGEMEFLAKDTVVILEDSDIFIKDAQINYGDILDGKLNLNIDATKSEALGDVNIKSLNINTEDQGILDIKDKRTGITVDFEDNIEINLKELYSFIEINDKSFDVKVIELEHLYEQSELLQELEAKKGTLFLSIYDFEELNLYFKADVYDLDLPMKKDGEKLTSLNFEGTLQNDAINANTIDNKISVYAKDNIVKTKVKETNLFIDTNNNDIGKNKRNMIFEIENSNIEFLDVNTYDIKSGTVNINPQGVYFNGKLENLDLPLKKEGKKVTELDIVGKYLDDVLIIKTVDNNLNLKSTGDNYYFIDIRNIDVILERSDTGEYDDKEIKLIGKNSNIYITDENKILSNNFVFELKDKKTTFTSKYKKTKLDFILNPNGYTIVNGIDMSDEFVNALLDSKIVSGGNIRLMGTGREGVLNGHIKFKDNKIKNMAFINNLILFLNTSPALINPLLAIPAAVDIVANKGFSVDGYEIKKGTVDFIYDHNDEIFYAKNIKTEGSIVDFEGFAVLNFKESTIFSNVNVAFMKAYTNLVKYIPLVNYIFLGEDKKITTEVQIRGDLKDPKYETNFGKESAEVPLDILERLINLPEKAVDSVIDDDEKDNKQMEEPKK